MKMQEYAEPDLYAVGERMPVISPSFHLWGHTFSPKRVIEETGVAFAKVNEPGEINVAGPFQGRSLDYGPGYGAGIIRAPQTISHNERLNWLLENVLAGYTRKFRKEYGIVEEVLYLTAHFAYKQPCCLMLPNWLIRSIPTDVPVVITCIQENDPPDSFAA